MLNQLFALWNSMVRIGAAGYNVLSNIIRFALLILIGWPLVVFGTMFWAGFVAKATIALVPFLVATFLYAWDTFPRFGGRRNIDVLLAGILAAEVDAVKQGFTALREALYIEMVVLAAIAFVPWHNDPVMMFPFCLLVLVVTLGPGKKWFLKKAPAIANAIAILLVLVVFFGGRDAIPSQTVTVIKTSVPRIDQSLSIGTGKAIRVLRDVLEAKPTPTPSPAPTPAARPVAAAYPNQPVAPRQLETVSVSMLTVPCDPKFENQPLPNEVVILEIPANCTGTGWVYAPAGPRGFNILTALDGDVNMSYMFDDASSSDFVTIPLVGETLYRRPKVTVGVRFANARSEPVHVRVVPWS